MDKSLFQTMPPVWCTTDQRVWMSKNPTAGWRVLGTSEEMDLLGLDEEALFGLAFPTRKQMVEFFNHLLAEKNLPLLPFSFVRDGNQTYIVGNGKYSISGKSGEWKLRSKPVLPAKKKGNNKICKPWSSPWSIEKVFQTRREAFQYYQQHLDQ